MEAILGLALILAISVGIWFVTERALDKQRVGRTDPTWPS
jgi:hypothetical protein